MTLWRPSIAVDLVVRFNEGIFLTPATGRSGNRTAPASGDRLVARRGSDNLSLFTARVPKAARVVMPGHRTAWTFSLTLAWQDLPLDTDMIAAVGVHIHAGSIPDADWRRGMRGERRSDGSLYSQVPTRGPDDNPDMETLVMIGFADTVATSFVDGTAVISLEGRDHRGLLLDSPLTPEQLRAVDPSQPLDVVIRSIVEQHRLLSPLVRVIPDPGDWSGALPSPGGDAVVSRVQRGPAATANRNRLHPPSSGSRSNSFWDTITHYCFLCGAIAYFVGDDIHIRRIRDIYETADLAGSSPSRPTPFRGGGKRRVEGEEFGVTRLVLGRNILEYDKKRTLTGNRAHKVECVSLNTSSTATGARRVLRAHWPQTNAQPTARSARGGDSQSDTVVIPVHGVTSVERLTEIARALYEEVSRGESSGSFKTKEMASYGGDDSDTDMMRLRPGMGVEILVDRRALSSRNPFVHELLRMASRPMEEQVEFVRTRVGDENLARVIVATARGEVSPLQRFFYITSVSLAWSSPAVQFDVEFTNYLDATRQVDRSADQTASNRRVAANSPNSTSQEQRRQQEENDRYRRATLDAERRFREVEAQEAAEQRARERADAEATQRRDEVNRNIAETPNIAFGGS